MLTAATILAMLCTALVTVVAVVFCMGMGANATPAQIHTLKLWMLGLAVLGIAGIVTGIVLLRAGRPDVAAAASIAPTVIIVVILIIALLT